MAQTFNVNATKANWNATNLTMFDFKMFQQREMDIPLLIFCIFLFTFGIIGNFFIIVFFVTKKRVEAMATYHIWIMLLALGDLCTCISGFAFFVIIRDQKCFSEVLARTSNVCMLVTILSLCGVSYDRYCAIANPFKNPSKKWKTVMTYVTMVFIAGWLEYLYVYVERFMNSTVEYLVSYSVTYVLTDCVIPVGFMFILYKKLSVKLNDLTKPLGQQTPKTSKLLVKRNQEALKIIKALNIVYIVNVVPVRISKIVLEFVFYLDVCPRYRRTIMIVIQFMMLLLYLNNCLNCIIYAGRMIDFRKFLMKAFAPWKTFESRVPILSSLRKISYETNRL